jgi:Zn-dependent protease with chaperone function
MSIELPPGTANYSNSTPPPNNKQLLVLLGLFLGAIALALFCAFWLAGTLVWAIPPTVEQQLGKAIVPIFELQAQPSPTQNKLNELLDRLEMKLPEAELPHKKAREQISGRDFQVLYIPEPTVNAVAIPGDRIIVYQGLLADMQSENELMMVLGHELGHFANRDHLRGLTRSLTVQLILSTIFGDVGSLGSLATNSIATLTNSQFSRSQEQQADDVGLTLLEKNYGHAAGATDFFVRLSQEDIPGMAILASHPPSKARVKNLEKLIAKRGYAIKEKTALSPELAVNR